MGGFLVRFPFPFPSLHIYAYRGYIYVYIKTHTDKLVEVKHLKSLVRNIIDPSRSLGHTDRALRAANVPNQTQQTGSEGDGNARKTSVTGVSQDQEGEQGQGQGVHGREKERCEECR